MPQKPCLFRCVRHLLLTLLVVFAPATIFAQTTTGAIEGRVLNPRTGEYVEGARLTVTGTTLEAFTDSGGAYRLPAVPAGSAQVTVFYTGATPQTARVDVAAGRTV
ncbi:MAG: carboxypeptidase regulatory-like domain-containing protein, partial [Opitutaceae bacterium]